MNAKGHLPECHSGLRCDCAGQIKVLPPPAKPEAPKQDRAREIAEEYVNPGGRIVAALAIRAYGDELLEGRDQLLKELQASLAAEKERAATYRASRDTAEAGYKLAEAEVTRLREVLWGIEAQAENIYSDAEVRLDETLRLCREAKDK